ncbi:hypothetical protein M9H77_17636 [Catharanthus roseus]|uniref:Uncharacterized protein n=1 Tax=Catharanthus roseus TaxID=4058 RepID=A0ACC0B573_CATRO|nr:hypothetical protein M9H77_17636 [Catharanthus roseus]
MCMGSSLFHDQDEDGMGVKGKRPIKGLLGEARRKNKRPLWIDEIYWPRCGMIGIPLHIKPSPNGIRGTRLRDREDGESGSTQQKDLSKRFSWRKYLEELHKHLKGRRRGNDAPGRAAMSVDPSTSSSAAATAAATSEVPMRDSSTLPAVHAPRPTSPLLDPIDGAPPSSRDDI